MMTETICDCGKPIDDECETICRRCRVDVLQTEMESRVKAEAKARGWHLGERQRAATGTIYIEVWKPTVDEDDDAKQILVRIGDHGTAHCHEDISLVVGGEGNPDDHTWEQFVAALTD